MRYIVKAEGRASITISSFDDAVTVAMAFARAYPDAAVTVVNASCADDDWCGLTGEELRRLTKAVASTMEVTP